MFFADLHIHSHYSIATSRDMTPEGLARWARLKGVTVIGTGDAIHPGWLKELGRALDFTGRGLFVLRDELRENISVPPSCASDIYFMMSAEISCIYSKRGRTRKVHCLVLFNDMEGPLRLQKRLAKIGNIASDGRPILGVDAKHLLKTVLEECPGALFVPAHIWTPHFSVLGSTSRFDSLEECFEELTGHIHAVETGLSSDPPMNWRVSALDRLTLISNSDAHSPEKLGREASVFDTEVSFGAMAQAITTRKGFEGTIEFFPEEGKYHYDGHRPCRVRMSPDETMKRGDDRCPACGKKMTLGVLGRVLKLADRDPGEKPADARPHHSLVSLKTIIAQTLGMGAGTKKVNGIYFDLLQKLGPELNILLNVPAADMTQSGYPAIAEAVDRVRSGNVSIEPGYDGEYGKIRLKP
jgi:uncharacterized protein (TIGR00375 family)